MLSISRRHFLPAVRVVCLLTLAAALGGCSMFGSSDKPAESKKKGWSMLPWGGRSGGGDATPYIEYQRTLSTGAEPLYTLLARNTNMTKTIEGRMETTLQTAPGDMKMDTQSFTLAPNEQKRLLVYPSRFHLTYEVTASFRD